MKDSEVRLEILSLLGRMHKTMQAILDELIQAPTDTMVDTQRDDPKPKKEPKIQTKYIGDELGDMFGKEIFEHLEVQDDGTVQIIKYITNTKKWNAINNFLREYGYKYEPVEKGLGSWRL